MVTRREAIANFLKASTHPDLAGMYTPNMEMQCNVARDDGERIEGEYMGRQWHGWSDGITTWKSFRVPFNAATNPNYQDSPMKFDLAKHAEGIGMTGWDFVDKVSRWVAFDFDAILGDAHKDTGLTHDQLYEVQCQATEIPWVTVRKSTSGNGLHLYVSLDPVIPTENHNEHSALARAILGTMAAVTGYNFENAVDICGGNMWVWHRKMAGTEGLVVIKQGKPFGDVPRTWRDHVAVVTGRKRKVIPSNIDQSEMSEEDKMFAELTGRYVHEKLDAKHKELIDWLSEHGCFWNWDQDSNMLVTHTYHLKEAHAALNLKGQFATMSEGRERGTDQNCFAFPIKSGGWVIRRFTAGVREHESWTQDGSGWTRCYLNVDPDLATASRHNEGVEHPAGGYVFKFAKEAVKVAASLGANMEVAEFALSRKTKLKPHKDGRLIAEVEKTAEDNPNEMKGWLADGKYWKKIFTTQNKPPQENEVGNFDELVRHIVSEQKEDAGWVVLSESVWIQEPLSHTKAVLRSCGLTDREALVVTGECIQKRWTIVNKPFQPEYPGDRRWNRDACQFMFFPSKEDKLAFPTWNKIFNHVGRGLNEAIKENPWAQTNGIVSGSDYLRCWVASLFQYPEEPLPYLFLYGPEASGKTAFHEALSLLITPSGYERADRALLSSQGFNGELVRAILCVVEETNLSQKNRTAYNRIKDWVTSRHLPVHPKGGTPYLATNTTHWVQCSNSIGACPVFTGDTRITMIRVDDIPESEWEHRQVLTDRLKKEGHDFLGSIMRLEIPESPDRLNVPVIATDEKRQLQQQNQTAIESFVTDCCHIAYGESIKLSEFWEKFCNWLEPSELGEWNKAKMGRSLPRPLIKGRRGDAQHAIGNVSFDEPETPGDKEFILRGQMLALQERETK